MKEVDCGNCLVCKDLSHGVGFLPICKRFDKQILISPFPICPDCQTPLVPFNIIGDYNYFCVHCNKRVAFYSIKYHYGVLDDSKYEN